MGMYTKWGVKAPLKPGFDWSELTRKLDERERGDQVLRYIGVLNGWIEGHGELKDYDDETTVLADWVQKYLDRSKILIGDPFFVAWYEGEDFPLIRTA